ncbi:hypothetical protein [Cumulibacter soli]|uniref:hypothetical protein n=1 Tax=Cumulibacter soli TaxID=2546344 RepID=UPI0010678FB9|nr:hypothetical protein [Cumulibacter soli]
MTGDDELIERIAEAILTASLPYSGPGGQTVPGVMPVHVDVARAALAVARPAIRNETLDEVAYAIGADICAWCPSPSHGSAWHNDGLLHPSCGQLDHGMGWVPDRGLAGLTEVQWSQASHAADLAYIEGDGHTLATRDLTNAITDAVLTSLGISVVRSLRSDSKGDQR